MATFEQLEKANKLIKPIDLGKGNAKIYAEVHQRIKAFRMIHPDGCILTTMVSNDDGICIFRAEAFDEDHKLLGTGTAFEKADSSFINKTSYIENCETSAVGRCLAMCGIGIDVSIASKEEVENAKLNQQKTDKAEKKEENPKRAEVVEEARQKARVIGYVTRNHFSDSDIAKLCKFFKKNSLQELTLEDCKFYIAMIEKKGGKIDE